MIYKHLLLTLICAVISSSSALMQDTVNLSSQDGKRQYYRVVQDIPEGSTFIGNVSGPNNFSGAVITAEPAPGFQEGKVIPGTETFYYLSKTNRGVRQPPNWVGFIEQEKVMPGGPVIGVYQANN